MTRLDRDFSDPDIIAAATLQPALVATHGRFSKDLTNPTLLTERERQVLDLTAARLTAYAIGSRLIIAVARVGRT